MDDNLKEEIKNNVKEEIADAGSKIDDKVEETATKYHVPKWVVWLSGAVVVGLVIKLIF